ncbi:uncharacterized protein LOC134825955 isoform X2 [Bolinopsis microptera]|uniref:uncharacterized protein LOC134825955 isoform X2 n=1 Tax=Bolinopsis microptera TaxID=2820187 RepID=UPI0030797666
MKSTGNEAENNSTMEQLLQNSDMVEIRVDKVTSGGFFYVRILSPAERAHQTNFKELHLTPQQEDEHCRALDEYAAFNFISLPAADPDKLLKQLVFFKSRDQKYYRGIVEKRKDIAEKRKDSNIQLFHIRNIDTRSMIINIPLSDIRLLPEKFGIKRWPPKILQFQLTQVKPVTLKMKDGMIAKEKEDTETWDTAAINFIKQSIKLAIVVCKICSMNPVTGVYDVMMYKQKTVSEKAVCINEEVIVKGFARKSLPGEEASSARPTQGPDFSPTTGSISTANISADSRRNRSPAGNNTDASVGGGSDRARGRDIVGRDSPRSGALPQFNLNAHKRSPQACPLILGCEDLQPVNSIESCNFEKKIKEQYIRGRGKSHTDLSLIQRYGWPFFEKGRDGVLVFPPDNTLRTELTFLLPLLSNIAKGTYGTFPRSYSPKILIIVPSCEDADLLMNYCRESLDESMKFSLSVHKAYTLSKCCPHAELWNTQTILIVTPDSLVKTHTEHIPSDGKSIYYNCTCHVVLHKSHDLFTRHRESMQQILAGLREERSEQEYAHACQITLFSDVWLPVFHAVIRQFMTDPIIMLLNRTEAALFGGVTSYVEEFSSAASKRDSFISTTRKLCDKKKKTAILVKSRSEDLVQVLKSKAVPCTELDTNGSQLQNWSPGSAMVINDVMAASYCVQDCDVILHYDMPGSLTAFNNRLSFLESHLKGLLTAQDCLSIFFLTEDEDPQSVNNLVKYLSRHSVTVPKSLQEKADRGENIRQKEKSGKDLCPYLRQYGSCTARACSMRHVVLVTDAPGSSLKVMNLPLKGKIRVKVSSVADGNRLYGRIMSVDPDPGSCSNAEEEFQRYSDKVQGWFNDKPSLIDEDQLRENLKRGKEVIVGVKDKKDGIFYRARVKSIRYNADREGKLDGIIGQCLDTGSEGLYPLEAVYRFPARLAERPAFTTELIVCGIKPTENDLHFSSYCKRELVGRVVGEVLEGNIELALGNTLWVRTLEKRQLLKNLKLMSSELSVKKVISDHMFGVSNDEHIKLLRAAVREALPDEVPDEISDVTISRVTVDKSSQHVVCVSHIESPHNLNVNIVENMASLADMEDRINNNKLLDSILPSWLPKHTYCMARYSKDNRWYRAEVLKTWHDKYHVYFVDYGNEDKAVPSNFVKTIPSHLLELPFQAVRCKLADISPITEYWNPADQQVMSEVTEGEDFYLELMEGPDDDNLYTVKLSYTDDGASLVDILCREPAGMNSSHIKNSVFGDLMETLYKSKEDYLSLCSADKLESQITSPDSRITPSDLVTLCRLTKIRNQDQDILDHLIRSLTHVISKSDGWSNEVVQEVFLGPLIDKLASPSALHAAVANLISAIGTDTEVFNHCILETKCIVSLCELCVYKADQTPKLLAVLHAIETLATAITVGEGGATAITGSDYIRKEIVATGHVRTLCKFVRESSDECLEKVLIVLARIFEVEKTSSSQRIYRGFKEEGGIIDVCKATRRTNSTAIIDIVNSLDLDRPETLTILKKEGLAEWFKALREKRRDFGTRIACDQFYKRISSHKIEEEDDLALNDPPPPVMTRAPITTPIDQPTEVKGGIGLDSITKQPLVLWHQRKRKVGISIQIKDVGKYKMLLIGDKTLEFSTWNSGFLFKFKYDLFAEVKDMKVSANNSEVRATLTKMEPVKWKGLLQNGAKKGTIKLDFSRAVDSDDETDSEEEETVMPPPLPIAENVEICIGEEPSSEEYLTEEEEIGDDYTKSFFNEINYDANSDDMDGLE